MAGVTAGGLAADDPFAAPLVVFVMGLGGTDVAGFACVVIVVFAEPPFAAVTCVGDTGFTLARGRLGAGTGTVLLTGATVAGFEALDVSAGGSPQLAGGGSGDLGGTS